MMEAGSLARISSAASVFAARRSGDAALLEEAIIDATPDLESARELVGSVVRWLDACARAVEPLGMDLDVAVQHIAAVAARHQVVHDELVDMLEGDD